MNIDSFDVSIRKQDGGIVVASIPELNLFAKGSSVDEALAQLDEKKRQLQAEFTEAGIDFQASPVQASSAAGAARSSLGYELARFAAKAIIVCVLILGGGLYAFNQVSARIEESVLSVMPRTIGGRGFWTKVDTELDRMADPKRDLPEEQKKKLVANVRAIAEKWRPLIHELAAAVFDPAPASASSPTSQTKN